MILDRCWIALHRIKSTNEVIAGSDRGEFMTVNGATVPDMLDRDGLGLFDPDPDLHIERSQGNADTYYVPRIRSLQPTDTAELSFKVDHIQIRKVQIGDWFFYAGFSPEAKMWVTRGVLSKLRRFDEVG